MDQLTQRNTKRNSFSTYVPVHRRTETEEPVLRRNSMYHPTDLTSKRSSLPQHRVNFQSDNNSDNRNNSDNKHHEDWENMLRQYDKYGGVEDDRRNSRRGSRLSEAFLDYTVFVPPPKPTTILDCFDFPPSFQNFHLHDIFKRYESFGGYTISWVSNTRALIVFTHYSTAKMAYIDNVTHPLATIRPYNGPSKDLLNRNRKK